MKKPKHDHVPAVVHRTGGPPADVLNRCGLCGKQIVPVLDPGDQMIVGWLSITDAMADSIREGYKHARQT